MKLKDWILIWQENYDAPSVRQTTYEAHRYVLENHILPRLGKWALNELTNERIRRFYTQCRKNGNHRTNQPLSDVTMRHIMVLLRKILRQAVTDGLLEREPMTDWSFHETKGVNAEPLTLQEAADYLDAAGRLGYRAMFTLAVRYGLRQRELIALRWSDVDMKKPSLTVHAGRVVKEGKLVEYAGKVRELRLSPEDAALLEQEHAKHPSSEVLFIHPGTLKPYSPNMVRLRHNQILEKAEIPHIRFEDLRHTSAVLALQNGMTATELTHLQGRCRSTLTRQSYAEHMNQTKKKQVQKAVSEQQYLKEEQQQAAQALDTLLAF